MSELTISYLSHDGFRATSDQHIKPVEANVYVSWDELKDFIRSNETVFTGDELADFKKVSNYLVHQYQTNVDPLAESSITRNKDFKNWVRSTYGDEIFYRAIPPKHKGHCILGVKIKDNPSLNQSKRILRRSENVLEHTVMILDVDDNGTLEQWKVMLNHYNLKSFIYTTSSHTDTAHCFRVLIPLKQAVSGEDYTGRKKAVYAMFRNKCDTSSINTCRYFYLPTRLDTASTTYIETDGSELDLLAIQRDAPKVDTIVGQSRKDETDYATANNLEMIKDAAHGVYLSNSERCSLIWALQGVGFSQYDAKQVDDRLSKGDAPFNEIWGRYKTVSVGKTRIENLLSIKLTKKRAIEFTGLANSIAKMW